MTTLTNSYQYIGRTGAVSCDAGYDYYVLLYAKTAGDVSTGNHTVSVLMRLACTSNSTFYSYRTNGSATVDGVSAISWNNASNPNAAWNGSLTVGGVTYSRHIDLQEGTAVIDTAYAQKNVTINASWNRISFTGDRPSYLPFTTTISASIQVTLPLIATASVPTAASPVKMGDKVTIYTNRIATSLTHTLTYSFGGANGTIATDVGDSYEWTVPDLAARISNKLSGTCTITCTTYSGSTAIGSNTVTITLQVPDASVPTMVEGYSTTAKMGSKVVIQTNRKSSNFTHTYTYAIGSATGTIASNIHINTGWSIPKDFASYTGNKLSASCVVTLTTYNGTAKVGSNTITLTLTVPDATVPTVSANSVALGGHIAINMPREASAYVHDIDMTLKATGSSAVAHNATVGTGYGTSVGWTLPYDFAAKIPAATSGTITLTVKTRFNGSTQIIGSEEVSFTITVPDNETTKPKITSLTLSPVHSLPSQFAGVYVKGKSKVAAAMAASSDHSTIYRYKITVNNKEYYNTTNEATNTVTANQNFSTPGDHKVKCTVIDARGYSRTIEQTITVIDYFAPRVIQHSEEDSIVCARCDDSGNLDDAGIYLKIKAGKSYARVISNGAQKNFCTLQYRYRASAGNFSLWHTLLADDSSYDYVSTVPIGNVVGDIKSSYVVELRVYDTLSGANNSHTLSFVVPTDQIDFHLREGGKGAAFGKYSEIEGLLDVDWDLRLSNGRHADVCLKSSSYYRWGEDSEQGLEEWFNTVLSTMPNNSVKFMEVFASSIHNWRFMGYLYKADNDYAAYFGICYDGTMMLKNKWEGTWAAAVKK